MPESRSTMTNSIKLQVEIEYFFRWQRPVVREKVEVLTKNGLLCTVDKCGTLSHLGNTDPCPNEVSSAARRWAGWIQDVPTAPPTSSKLDSLREELKANLTERRNSFSEAVKLSCIPHYSEVHTGLDSALDYYHECQQQVDEVRAAIALLI